MNKLHNTYFDKHAETYNSLYLNRFFSLHCAEDLLRCRLFPNAKEVTESFAAINATQYLPVDWKDSSVNIVCVGDGETPRTAATFAHLTKWNCYSVDPVLKIDSKYNDIQRLYLYQDIIEHVSFNFNSPIIICLVHSHAKIKECLKQINAPQIHIIAIPCCVNQWLDKKADVEYNDANLWSPKNLVKVWINI